MMTETQPSSPSVEPQCLRACYSRTLLFMVLPLLAELLAYLLRPDIYPAYLPFRSQALSVALGLFYFALLFSAVAIVPALAAWRLHLRPEHLAPPLFFGLFLALTLSRLLPADSGASPARLAVFAVSIVLTASFYLVIVRTRLPIGRLAAATILFTAFAACSLARLFQPPLQNVFLALVIYTTLFAMLLFLRGKWIPALAVFLLVLFYPAHLRHGMAPSTASMPPYERVILVGMDALSPDVLSQMIGAGSLPAFSQMVRTGTSGRLQTLSVPFSPVVWNSIYTGMVPRRHGIMAFTFTRFPGAPPFASLWLDNWSNSDWMHLATRTLRATHLVRIAGSTRSNDRLKAALWNMVGQNGGSSIVVGGWTTYPPEKIRGVFVSDYAFSADPAKRLGSYYPVDRRVEDLLSGAPDVSAWPSEIRRYIARDMRVHSASIGLFPSAPAGTRLFFAYYSSADAFGHHFGQRIERRETSAREAARLIGIRDAVYSRLDSYVEDYRKLLDDRSLLIVCSDHGFHFDKRQHNYPVDGVILVAGKGVRKTVVRGNMYSIAPTVLYALGLPTDRNFAGQPLREIFDGSIAQPPARSYSRNTEFFEEAGEKGFQEDKMQELQDLGYIDK